MAFQPIRPKQGKRPSHLAGVTVSWRKRSNVSTMGVAVNIAAAIIEQLGWERGQKIEVAYCTDTNRVRLQPADHGYRMVNRDGSGVVTFPLEHVEHRHLLAAALVKHEVDGAALTVSMPSWAWHPGFKAARDAAAEAAARAGGKVHPIVASHAKHARTAA